MVRRVREKWPNDLQARLEAARLHLLALFRALDQPYFARFRFPQDALLVLFQLDADFAEALAVGNHPLARLNVRAMVADTLASLQRLQAAEKRFLDHLDPAALRPLEQARSALRISLITDDAYHGIPGHVAK